MPLPAVVMAAAPPAGFDAILAVILLARRRLDTSVLKPVSATEAAPIVLGLAISERADALDLDLLWSSIPAPECIVALAVTATIEGSLAVIDGADTIGHSGHLSSGVR